MENRRRFPRFETAFQVKYYPSKKVKKFSYTISKNVSMGGLCMPALSTVAKRGELIKMDINKNGGENRISAIGKVKWVKPIKRKALLDTEAGIEFIDIVPADLNKLVPAIL